MRALQVLDGPQAAIVLHDEHTLAAVAAVLLVDLGMVPHRRRVEAKVAIPPELDAPADELCAAHVRQVVWGDALPHVAPPGGAGRRVAQQLEAPWRRAVGVDLHRVEHETAQGGLRIAGQHGGRHPDAAACSAGAQHADEHLAHGAVREGRVLFALRALVQRLGYAGQVDALLRLGEYGGDVLGRARARIARLLRVVDRRPVAPHAVEDQARRRLLLALGLAHGLARVGGRHHHGLLEAELAPHADQREDLLAW